MANKRLYDEKTGEGWAKVAGKWHYFRDGKILELAPIPGLRDADQRLKTWRDTTKKKVKKAVEPHVEQVKKGFLLAGESIQDTSKQVGKGFQIAAEGAQAASKKYVYDPVNKVPGLWKDLGDRTIGSGEFDDKGRELSVFELKKQKEKYKNNSSDESLKDESVVIPEAEDMYSIGLMAMNNSDPNSDWSKIWNIDYSKFPLEQKVSFKAAMEESFWLGGNDTYTNDTLDRLSSSIGSAYTAAVSNPANSTTLGGMNTNDPTIREETQKDVDNNIVSAVTGNTQTPKMTTTEWTTDQGVNDPGVTTDLNLPEKQEPKVTQWYDLEGEDGGEAAKQMARQKLADQKVEVKPEDIQTNQTVLPTGTLPESTFSSRFWDFLNNRRGGK